MLKLSFVLFELAWLAVFCFVICHELKRGGKEKTITFFVPAILFGFLLEWATQTIFHGYQYGDGFLLYVLNVPVSVSLTWSTLLYLGLWLFSEKFTLKQRWMRTVAAAFFLVTVDALHFEPMANAFGYWTWNHPGIWFGAALSNFYGWFWVVVLFLTGFQWVETQKWEWKKKLAAGLALIPIQVGMLTLLLKLYEFILGKV